MKKLFTRFKDFVICDTPAKILLAAVTGVVVIIGIVRGKAAATRRILASSSGEGYVDTAVKILMAVVIGALVLAGLYALFGDTVMPTLTRRIQEMFNYNG